ncbi:MAG: ribonuclease E/G, partial [Trichlorobacter sp.]|uniref:ribonuclease E/G n=1 Tax=Trichlorobacter sp. TaxID=2911007 RepID=UPI00256214D2
GAGEVYQDAGVIIRTIRDYFSDDVDEVLVDDKAACQQAIDFFKEIMPGCERLVKLHKEKRPIFSKYQLEEQIDQLYEKRVPLPSGGSLVIEPTEALVSIDVNSGKSSGEKGVEDTAFKTNLEAAAEVARQLRLRDLGGLVVIDFIDMRDNKHNKEVERTLKDALKIDKARVNLGRISQFGMMEMSRQRIAKNINDAIHLECPHCEGRGRVKSVEAMAVSFLRKVHAAAAKGQIAEVRGGLPLEVAYFLLNRKKRELAQIENDYEIVVTIKGKPSFLLNQLELETVRKEKLRDDLPELELPHQSAPVDIVDSVTITEVPELEAVTEAVAKKRRKRKRKKKSADRPADLATAEQPDDVLGSSVIEESVAVTGEDVVFGQPAEPQEPVAKKRRRSRSRRKPAVVNDGETESGGQDTADAGSPQVPVPVDVSDGDAPVLPVKASRPKRTAKKVATVVIETNIGEDQPVPPADPVVVKPAARARKSPARKKTAAPEPVADEGVSIEPATAPKARKRSASRSKKNASIVADEGKE